MRAVSVFKRSMSARRLNSGIRFAMPGSIMRTRIAFQRKADPGTFTRAKKYAAQMAASRAMTVAEMQMKKEFARVGPTAAQAVVRFSQWYGAVSRAGAS